MDNINELVGSLLAEWSLIPDGSCATGRVVIQHARRATGEAVTLKVVPDQASFESERAALEAFSGRGSVQLIATVPRQGALLLERVEPGDPLGGLVAAGRDEEATQAAADVARRLRTAPTVEERARLPKLDGEAAHALHAYSQAHGGANSLIPPTVVEASVAELQDLMSSADEVVVLHGDLHHDNILRAHREPWLAIDPKGRLGEPVCEYAALVRNPIDWVVTQPDLRPFLARRLDQLAEHAGCDRVRVTMWSRVLAVVAACWALEDDDRDWQKWLDAYSGDVVQGFRSKPSG
jgi:streptomycin 6-kinase